MKDLIERQAAIDAIIAKLDAIDHVPQWVFDELAGVIGELPSVQPYTEADIQKMQELEQAELDKAYECGRASAQPEQRWIPVTERLPEDGKWCLFTDGVNSSVERYKADAMDHFFPEGRWFGLEDTVAWMPLPAPYTERREE